MPPRILILTAAVGAGHVRAAEAVELALRARDPSAHIERHDVMALTNAVFRRVYGKAYLDLVSRAPHLVGMMYDLSDSPQATRGVQHKLRHLVQQRNLSRVVAKIDEGWDIVVHTHFLAPDLMASMARKRRKPAGPPMVTVVTDFEAHGFWVNPPCARYFVATTEAALALSAWGVPADTIQETGIPIHPVFSSPLSAQDARTAQKLASDTPVILLLSGGFGLGPVEKIYAALAAIERPIQLIAVCGKNDKLKAKLEAIKPPPRHRTTILGFTTEMDRWLAAADLVVTKPGGLTTSECLARGAAMVIMNPIPGQESRNSDWLLERGAAVKVNSLATLGWKVSRLLDDPARLAGLKQTARSLGRPNAAFDIADRVLAMIAR
jgi:processive 1,2-diacylglycerol beta-glucosyltransferase